MDFDTSNILFGGFSAVMILVFLVQTVREAWNVQNHHIPLVAIVLSLVMFLGAYYLPEDLVETIATGLFVAAGASFTVRYVKNGVNDEYTPRSTAKRVQRDDSAAARVSGSEWNSTTRIVDQRG